MEEPAEEPIVEDLFLQLKHKECYSCSAIRNCLRVWRIIDNGESIYICKYCILEFFAKGQKSEYTSDEEDNYKN